MDITADFQALLQGAREPSLPSPTRSPFLERASHMAVAQRALSRTIDATFDFYVGFHKYVNAREHVIILSKFVIIIGWVVLILD